MNKYRKVDTSSIFSSNSIQHEQQPLCGYCDNWLSFGKCPTFYCSSHNDSATTQKSRGLIYLYSSYSKLWQGRRRNLRKLNFRVIPLDTDAALGIPNTEFPFYARPAPSRPRHGFVDSRLVSSHGQLVDLIKETHKADPKGEIILTKYIESAYNIVITPGLLTIGEGNDGATSGKRALDIPTINGDILEMSTIAEATAGIEQAPYVEAVFCESKAALGYTIYLTQLRDGPRLRSVNKNFIPRSMEVKAVYVLADRHDLLAWEQIVNCMEPNTVVYNKVKFGLGSHYAIHCIIKDIPFLTFEPCIGDKLEASRSGDPLDPDLLLDGIKIGLKLQKNGYDWCKLGIFALAMLHNLPAFGKDQSKLVGIAIAVSIRLGLMALYGESRHRMGRDEKHFSPPARESVFEVSWYRLGQSLSSLRNLRKRWRYNLPSSVGGTRWGSCQEATEAVICDIKKLARLKKREAKLIVQASLLMHFNTMINVAHNNGKWFNKFFLSDWFSIAEKMPSFVAMQVAPVIFRLSHEVVPNEGVIKLLGKNEYDIPDVYVLKTKPEDLLEPWRLGGKCTCDECSGGYNSSYEDGDR